jgi:nucleoside-diphosphate-sugar epimerase
MAPDSTNCKPVLLVTGCSGFIGANLAQAAADDFQVVGFDRQPPPKEVPLADWIPCDMTDDTDVEAACRRLVGSFGSRLASVVHLAAYYDFAGEPSPLYRTLTVEGTQRLLEQLQAMEVEQFIFSSTLLVMKPADDDEPLTAMDETQAEWDYPQSKLHAERVIAQERGDIPAVILRIAGVYNDDCHSIPIAQQISRIHQKQLESYFFPGDKTHGQAFVHIDDLVQCIRSTIDRRKQLGPYETFLIGEEDVMSYAELQEELGKQLHGEAWPTIRISKPLAKAGAWIKEKLAFGESEQPFIKPWMIDLADQHYPVSLERAKQQLHWQPQHTLRGTIPEMIRRLHDDPRRWYRVNGIPLPKSLTELHEAGARS